MADFGDQAQAVSDAYRSAALSACAGPQGPGEIHCVDCDAEIPAARRAAVKGVKRCVDCQEGLENGID